MGDLITQFSLVTTFVVGLVGNVVTMIVGQPLLLIGFGVALLGSGVSLFKKLK